MSLLKDVAENIILNGKLDINKFGIFQEIKYEDWLYYTPHDKALTTIRIYPSKDICFSGGNFNIKEIESILGKYTIGYNWRDDYTRFTFNEIQTNYVESIYFEKENKVEYDETSNQFISKDDYGKQTIIPYNELTFNSFTIKYKSV